MIKNIKCDTEVAGPALSHHSPIPTPMTLQRNSPPRLVSGICGSLHWPFSFLNGLLREEANSGCQSKP